MKYKLILFTILIFNFVQFNAISQIVYIDINFVVNNSDIGKSLNDKLEKKKINYLEKYKNKEKVLIDKENALIAQQNILQKNEFEKKANILSEEINNYRSEKKKINDELKKIKIENTKKILNILNPIITDYVDSNSISLVIPKKNIIIGKKNLDITIEIIKLLNQNSKTLDF